jgi:hypothetical protein
MRRAEPESPSEAPHERAAALGLFRCRTRRVVGRWIFLLLRALRSSSRDNAVAAPDQAASDIAPWLHIYPDALPAPRRCR